jgi:VWFA-related protein
MRLFGSLTVLALVAWVAALPSQARAQFPTPPLRVQPDQIVQSKTPPQRVQPGQAGQTKTPPLRVQPGAEQKTVPGQSQSNSQPAQQPQFKPLIRRVTVVTLPVTVRGPHGHLALDLGPEDFQVYDDGNLEHIIHFNVGGEPVSAVLVVEDNDRVASVLPTLRKTGIIFTQAVMGGNGEGSVIAFDDKARVIVPFTFDHERIQKSIAELKPGESGSHLYDALAEAVQMLENQPENRRRVIVAISESRDTGSLAKLGSILRDAQLANITIYSIGLSSIMAKLRAPASQYSPPAFGPPGTFAHPGYPGSPQTPSTMEQQGGNMNLLALVETLVKMGVNLVSPEAMAAASAATGGDHIRAFHDHSIEEALYRVGTELHAEYTLAYQAPQHGPWTYHEITVKITRPGYTVRTRPGYFLAPPNGSTTGSQ